ADLEQLALAGVERVPALLRVLAPYPLPRPDGVTAHVVSGPPYRSIAGTVKHQPLDALRPPHVRSQRKIDLQPRPRATIGRHVSGRRVRRRILVYIDAGAFRFGAEVPPPH